MQTVMVVSGASERFWNQTPFRSYLFNAFSLLLPSGEQFVIRAMEDAATRLPEATLAEGDSTITWRQWVYEFDATPGRHQVTCRATDGSGDTQTEERAKPFPDGASGWHSVAFLVD